jgi:hypothetical protein
LGLATDSAESFACIYSCWNCASVVVPKPCDVGMAGWGRVGTVRGGRDPCRMLPLLLGGWECERMAELSSLTKLRVGRCAILAIWVADMVGEGGLVELWLGARLGGRFGLRSCCGR